MASVSCVGKKSRIGARALCEKHRREDSGELVVTVHTMRHRGKVERVWGEQRRLLTLEDSMMIECVWL